MIVKINDDLQWTAIWQNYLFISPIMTWVSAKSLLLRDRQNWGTKIQKRTDLHDCASLCRHDQTLERWRHGLRKYTRKPLGCCEVQHGVLVGHHEHRSLWRCSSWWVWRNTVDGMQIMTQQEWLKKKLKEEAGKLKKICISLNYKIWRVPAFLMAIKELIA